MSYVVQFLVCYALWVLLVWPFRGGALAPGAGQDFAAGVVVALIATALSGRLFPRNVAQVVNPMRYVWFVAFIPVFVWACIVANLDVAYRVLHLRLPIRPGIVRVRTSIKSPLGRVILANSITLTPGTLSVDMVGQDLYIHWINVTTDSPEMRADEIMGRFEGILKKVFD